MNICVVSYEFPPMIGGEGSYTYGLFKAIADLGHDVTVVTTDLEGELEKELNMEIIRLSPSKKPFLKMFSFNVRAKERIKDIYRDKKIDVVHYPCDYNDMAISKKELNVPSIATIHHPYAAERRIFRAKTNNFAYFRYLMGKKIPYLERMEKRVCEKVDKIIAVSRYTAQDIIKNYNISAEKVSVIPNAVDTERFNPKIKGDKIRREWHLTQEPVILFVGRLDYHKGVEYLIKSFTRIVTDIIDAKLVIVGEGPLKYRIAELINKYNLRKSILLAGKVEDKDLPEVYAASDLVVLPSLMEGFGIVLLEAMASGKPCVATKAGGTEDVILDGKTGLLVPYAKPVRLYQAICGLLTNDSNEFGLAGRKRVEEYFTWDIVARRMMEVYKGML